MLGLASLITTTGKNWARTKLLTSGLRFLVTNSAACMLRFIPIGQSLQHSRSFDRF